MKTATYLFDSDVFNSMPYGDTTKSSVMRQKASVVIIGHTVIKHPTVSIAFNITNEQLIEMKAIHKGIVVTAPTL
jgi:hypothetical protein